MENRKGIRLLLAACETVIEEDRVSGLVRRAIVATDQGDVDAAIQLLRTAEDINPMHLDPAVMLGVLLHHEKSQQFPAMTCFHKAITQDPNNALSLWYLACDNLRSGRITEAVTLLSAAADCEPVDSYAVLTLAWVLRMLGTPNDAKRTIERRLLADLVTCVCPTLELLLGSQETDLNAEEIGYLFGEKASCLIDLGCATQSKNHHEKLLNAMLNNANKGQISEDILRQSPNCVHLTNPALDSYMHRYGERVVKHYARAFLDEILVPEITRIFSRNRMRRTRSKKDDGDMHGDMVLVPAGQYTIGFNSPSLKHPERKCFVPAFLIDKYPVTNQQWREFNPNHTFPKGLENNPVTNVDFIQSTMYARWKGKRLPTEIEWEAAARGQQAFRFPWGHIQDPGRANCADSKPRATTSVTRYPRGASTCGALDMLGNALEWVDDWGPSPSDRLETRVVKGGGFTVKAADLACWLRSFFSPVTKHPNIGFRCVMDV